MNYKQRRQAQSDARFLWKCGEKASAHLLMREVIECSQSTCGGAVVSVEAMMRCTDPGEACGECGRTVSSDGIPVVRIEVIVPCGYEAYDGEFFVCLVCFIEAATA
jgi:hypothetical protein